MTIVEKKIICFFTILFFLFIGCQNHDKTYDFKLHSSDVTGVDFRNDLPISEDLNIFNYMYYYNGSGLGAGDLNNDGLVDLIFASNLGPEKVYLNQGDFQFSDVSSEAGIDGGINSWTNGISLADINSDGLIDVYLSQVGSYRHLDCTNKLFICTGIDSDGIPRYEEKAREYGLDFKGFSTQAGFFDMDNDGDLDMFLMNHSLHHNGTFGRRSTFLGTTHELSGDRLFRNDGDVFTDITLEAGIHSSVIGYGLGLAFGDFDRDGWTDIYIGNDFHENDYLYINQQDGTFTDKGTEELKSTSKFSMGVDVADINNDLWDDIMVLDMLPDDPYILKTSEGEDALDLFRLKENYGYSPQYARNSLQINQGNNSFKELARYANVFASDWSWSPLMVDLDMDRNKDIFVSNGIPKRMNDLDYIRYVSGNEIQYKIQFDELEKKDLSALDSIPEIKIKNKFYHSLSDLQFTEDYFKIMGDKVSYSNSAIYADLDNDGDYDLVTNNINDEAFIYENLMNPETVEVKLEGNDKNRHGLGAKIIGEYEDGEKVVLNNWSTRAFQSSMITDCIFPRDSLLRITVIWPNKMSETKTTSTTTDEIIFRISEANQENSWPTNFTENDSLLVDITGNIVPEIFHEENDFVEFNREPLIPFSTSAEGPAISILDLNNDGYEDIFVGSGKRENSAIYIQRENGQFQRYFLQGKIQDSIYEEVASIFVDIDGDEDQDLIIATGGNEFRLNSDYTRPILYRNENDQLTRDTSAFRDIHLAASSVAYSDIDGDGDLDLFFGGRALTWEYGQIPDSYLLLNDGKGRFSDQTELWSKELKLFGLIKDASFADMDNDGHEDLVISREWGSIDIFYNDGSILNRHPVTSDRGWWNKMTISDFDNDGYLDIFVGNTGLNTRYKASTDRPIKMYYFDFDNNGTKEQIVTYFLGDREIVFNNIKELQQQLPHLKKKYLYAKKFAQADLEDLFGEKNLKKSRVFSVNNLSTSLFRNNGDRMFESVALPDEIQYSQINTAISVDLNNDGLMDIVPGGNYFYNNIQAGRYNAESGSYLINNGNMDFTYHAIPSRPITGQVNTMATMTLKDYGKVILAAQNDDKVVVLDIK